MGKLRVLVVDDSSSFRSAVARVIDESGLGRVVAHASNGQEALEKAREYHPDLVTLDIEMPVMDGLEALPKLREAVPATQVVMLTTLSRQGARGAKVALQLGALDFVEKPHGGEREQLHSSLRTILLALNPDTTATTPVPRTTTTPARIERPVYAPPGIVAIGSSTGGPQALQKIIPKLPKNLPVPVVIAQHLPSAFSAPLVEALAEQSAVKVVEGRDGAPLEPGVVYVAPGGRHLKVKGEVGAPKYVELSDEPPEHFCRPAVDVLFRSVAAVYRERALGVILTGMGKDGTEGLRAMRAYGVRVLGQSEASCTVYGMPREAMRAGVVDQELPAEELATEIVSFVNGRR